MVAPSYSEPAPTARPEAKMHTMQKETCSTYAQDLEHRVLHVHHLMPKRTYVPISYVSVATSHAVVAWWMTG